MAATGEKRVGHKPPGPCWVEEMPVDCVGGCRCGGKKHKWIDACDCATTWICAMHRLVEFRIHPDNYFKIEPLHYFRSR